MWSSSRLLRIAVVGVGLALAPILSACSGFTPVYGNGGVGAANIAIAYAAPNNRTEQIIYEDLALRLPAATGPAPKLTVTAGAGSRDLTSNTIGAPMTPEQVTVTARIKLVDVNGKVIFSGTRSQSADLNGSPQVLAEQQALNDATARAAHLLADTIRLTVLGALSK